MRFTLKWPERFLELKERGAGKADHLPAFVDQMHLRHAQRADDDDLPVVVIAVGGRASREPGVCRLHNDNLIGRHTRIEYFPLFDKAPWPHDRQHRTAAESETCPILSGALRARQNVAISHDRFELLDQSPAIASLIRWRRFDVLRSGRHDSVSDTYEIKSYKGIVRPRLLPIRCQPPADLESQFGRP